MGRGASEKRMLCAQHPAKWEMAACTRPRARPENPRRNERLNHHNRSQMSKTRRPNKTVELIASGYEWTCPRCEDFQREIEAKAKVTCGKCNTEFATDAPQQAYER
jgi:hypothetical protein